MSRIRSTLRRAHVAAARCRRRGEHAVEAGMTTAEYAVGTLAAVTFAVVLLAVVKSGAVKSALSRVIVSALGLGS